MKKYIQLLFCLSVAVAFYACDADNEGAMYRESGVSFLSPTSTVVVDPAATSFDVRVVRSNKTGSETFSLTSTGGPEFTVPASVTFPDGEAVAFIQVSISNLEFDKTYSLAINLSNDQVTPSNIGKMTISITKEYDWQLIGTGSFIDNFTHGTQYPVEIMKADGFERYRVLNPYAKAHDEDHGEWDSWIAGSGPKFVEFWSTTGDLIRFATYNLGINYDGNSNTPIKAYYPTDLNAELPIGHNKKTGDKTYQLAPYFYMDGLGGWDRTEGNGIIIITIP